MFIYYQFIYYHMVTITDCDHIGTWEILRNSPQHRCHQMEVSFTVSYRTVTKFDSLLQSK